MGIALHVTLAARVAMVVLRMVGVRIPLSVLPLVTLAAAVLAWRRLSARVLPDAVTMLAGRRLFGVVLAFALGLLGGGVAGELTLHGAMMAWSPEMPALLAPLCGYVVYAWCRRLARRWQDAGAGRMVVGIVGDMISAAAKAASSCDD